MLNRRQRGTSLRRGRRRTVVAVAAAASLALAACGSTPKASSSATGNLELWAVNSPGSGLSAAIAAFNSSHGVKITSDLIDAGNAYDTKLQPAVAAHQLPNLFAVTKPTMLKALVSQGQLLDLSSIVSPQSPLGKNLEKSVLALGTVNGKVYGIPYVETQPMTFFYNKDVFKKAGIGVPKTWDQLMADVPQLKKASSGSCAIAFDGGDTYSAEWYQQDLLQYIGGMAAIKRVDSGAPSAWKSPDLAKVDALLSALVAEKPFEYGAGAVQQTSGVPFELVATGKCAMYLTGAYGYGNFVQYAPSFVKSGGLGWFPFPALTTGQESRPLLDIGTLNLLVINKNSANVREAESFLQNYIFSPTRLGTLLSHGFVPPVSGIGAQVAKFGPGSYQEYIYNLEKSAAGASENIKDEVPGGIEHTYQTESTALILGQITPATFANIMSSAASRAGL